MACKKTNRKSSYFCQYISYNTQHVTDQQHRKKKKQVTNLLETSLGLFQFYFTKYDF